MIRIALAQQDFPVGDMTGNLVRAQQCIEQAVTVGADLVLFPELAISGYPPEDLVFMPQFIETNLNCLKEIIGGTSDICAIVGFVDKKRQYLQCSSSYS